MDVCETRGIFARTVRKIFVSIANRNIPQTLIPSTTISLCTETREVTIRTKTKNRKHKTVHLLTSYESKQSNLKEQVITMRIDTIYQFQVLLKELNVDVKHQLNVDVKKYPESEMDVMSRKIKNSMDEVFKDRSYLRNVHRC